MKRNMKQIRKQGGILGVLVLMVLVLTACGSGAAPAAISNTVIMDVKANSAEVEANTTEEVAQANLAIEAQPAGQEDAQAGAAEASLKAAVVQDVQAAQEGPSAFQAVQDPSQVLAEQGTGLTGEPAAAGEAGQAPADEQAAAGVTALAAPAVGGEAPAQKVAVDPAVLNLQTKPEVGFLAPDFSLQSLDGQTVRLADLRGRPVMVNYWATWCNPCMAELPILEKLQAEFAPQGLVIVTINAIEQDSLGDVQAVVSQMGLSLPILLDAQSQFQSTYKQLFFPTSYYIDTNGVIRYIKLGDAPEADIRSKLELLIHNQL